MQHMEPTETMETAADNARSSGRVEPTRNQAIVHGLTAEPVTANVIDESFGGIGIEIPVKLNQGDDVDIAVNVEYGGVTCIALVRHISAMDDGTKMGLEWKAQALSRCLREILSADTQVNRDLTRILPGGLSMMWKLFEARRWEFLLDSADRLRREVASAGIQELSQPITEFQEAVQSVIDVPSAESSNQVCNALNGLIGHCVRLVSE